MGLLSRLFGSDDSCGGHHFEDYEGTEEYSFEVMTLYRHDDESVDYAGEWIGPDLYMIVGQQLNGGTEVESRKSIVVRENQIATCVHSGCLETNEKQRTIGYLDLEEILDLAETDNEND